MIYRVMIKVGYQEAFFDFSENDQAMKFATDILSHQVSEEGKRITRKVTLMIVDPTAEVEDE